MVLSYLRWESDPSSTFGLISSSTCNVLYQKHSGLAISGGSEGILIWNIKQGVILTTLTPDDAVFKDVGAVKRPCVTVLCAHPLDSSLIAAGYSDGTVRIWSVTKKTSLVTLHGHRTTVSALIFSHDASNLYSGSHDTDIIAWDVISEHGLFRLKGHKGPVTALVLLEGRNKSNNSGAATASSSSSSSSSTSNHHHLLSSSKDELIKLWDLSTQHCVQTLVGHRAEVTALAVNGRENLLVSGAAEGHLRVWKIGRGGAQDATEDLKRKKQPIVKMEVDSSAVASSSTDSPSSPNDLITFWGVLPRESTKRVCSLSFWPLNSPDPILLISQAQDRLLEMYGVRSTEEIEKKVKRRMKRQREKQKKQEKAAGVTGNGKEEKASKQEAADMMDVDTDATAAASSSSSTNISTLPIPIDQFHPLLPIRTNIKIVSFSVSTSSVHLRILLGMHDNSMQVWNVDLEQARKVMEEDAPAVPAASSSSTNTLSPHYTQLYSLLNSGHRTGIRVVSINSDSTTLLTASSEQLKIWNIHSKQCIRTIDCGYALCGFFVPGSRHVLIGTKAGDIELYDLSTGNCLQKISAHSGPNGTPVPCYCLDLNPNQKGFISGGGDKELKQWEFELVLMKEHEDAQPIRSLQIVHTKTLKLTDDILCCKMSPDGKLIALGLLDSTIKIFYADSLKFFLSLYGHKLPVLCIDISSDSNLLLSGSADKNIKLWGLDFGDCHRSLFGHQDSITCVRFLPRSHLFFSTSKDRVLKIWDGDTFEQIQALEGHTQEVWGLAVMSNGMGVVTAGNDKSIRICRQTDSQLFLEEERETTLEALYDTSATSETKRIGEMIGSGLRQESESTSVARTKANAESLKAGERLMEALELADAEKERWMKYHEAVEEQKAALSGGGGASSSSSSSTLTPLQKLAADISSREKSAPIPVPPRNPLIRGVTAEDHVLAVLSSIRTPELDEALLLLPYEYVMRLVPYLNHHITLGLSVELCTHALLFLLTTHHKQLISNQSMLDTLRDSRSHVREQLTQMKARIGFNLAAMKFMQRQAKESSGMYFFGEKEKTEGEKQIAQEEHIRKKRKV